MADTDIVKRSTVDEMVAAYEEAMRQVQIGFGHLQQANALLQAAFAGKSSHLDFAVIPDRCYGTLDTIQGRAMEGIKGQAWRQIVAKLGVATTLSEKRERDLHKQLEEVASLPEINTRSVLDFVAQWAQNAGTYEDELVAEVFDFLRRASRDYVSVSSFRLGKRTIVEAAVHCQYGRTWFPNPYRDTALRNVQALFQRIDGKGAPKTCYGDLYDAIHAMPLDQSTGETEYFRFRCYRNGNLHIEFKRPDLVAELNRRMGRIEQGLPKATAA